MPFELGKLKTLVRNGGRVTGDVLRAVISNSPATEYAGDVTNQSQCILTPSRSKIQHHRRRQPPVHTKSHKVHKQGTKELLMIDGPG